MPYLADHLRFIPTAAVPLSLKSYIRGETPLSTWPAAFSMTVTYLTIVFGTREIMKDRAPFRLVTLFRAHNLLLSVASFILMLLLGEEVVSNWIKFGSYGVLCADEAYTQVSVNGHCDLTLPNIHNTLQNLELYLLINYYFKYYEFVDTIFLALKKKPLSKICCSCSWTVLMVLAAFLHVYHHSATAILMFVELNGRTTVVSNMPR